MEAILNPPSLPSSSPSPSPSLPSTTIPVTIPTPDYTLSGQIYPSLVPPLTPPVLFVLCHGLLNARYSRIVRTMATALLPTTSVLVFDFQGNGSSTGTTNYGNYEDEVHALHHVVLHTRSLGYRVVGIAGHSKGAADVLLYASQYGDVPLVVNIAARYDHTQAPIDRFTADQRRELEEKGSFVWLTYGWDVVREYVVRKEDLERRTTMDMSGVARIDRTRTRVLTVHGSADEIVPVKDAYAFEGMLNEGGPDGKVKCHELVIVEGAGHSFVSAEEQEGLAKAMGEFVNVHWDFAIDVLDGTA
ncbi:Alpha/Beta hydrolase protein [Jimgerdemannia flammicorona]|uniref:Alpha/Beta hydrolase protein n=2 Tax=Jimgerdemannia flammicorona TaxID=994334 RepID=A0A433QCX3_9FUNG|nr:Alpha/Beta hydrolase protein [Jimgerdemannia flammicorona]RUS27579.1 Alpha/Beta hydrolase protein [Jimgerdemannia flammicorona]